MTVQAVGYKPLGVGKASETGQNYLNPNLGSPQNPNTQRPTTPYSNLSALHFSSQIARIHRPQFGQQKDQLANIPVASLEDFQSGDPTRVKRFVETIGNALRDVGFFALTDHGISNRLFEAHYKALDQLFHQTTEERRRDFALIRSQGIERGYLPAGELKPTRMQVGTPSEELYVAGLHIRLEQRGDQLVARVDRLGKTRVFPLPEKAFTSKDEQAELAYEFEGRELRFRKLDEQGSFLVLAPDLKGNWITGREQNVYPAEVPDFALLNQEVYRAMDRVGVEIVKAISQYLGDDHGDLLKRSVDSDGHPIGTSMMRAIHYPPYNAEELAVTPANATILRAGEHKDISFFTMLPQATESGLQLLQRDGSWLPVSAQKGMIIVNAGDTLSYLTQGLTHSRTGESLEMRSTLHRVTGDRETVSKDRYATPFFFNLNLMEDLVSLTDRQPLRVVDPVKKIDVTLDQGLKLVYERFRASNVVPADVSYEAFRDNYLNLDKKLQQWVTERPALNPIYTGKKTFSVFSINPHQNRQPR